MAPEQRGGHAADTRSDQYSFCAALHEAFTGKLPPAYGARVPKRLRKILARGLARPEDRYASMDELLADLANERGSRAVWLAGLALALVVVAAAFAYARGRHTAAAVADVPSQADAPLAAAPVVVTPSALAEPSSAPAEPSSEPPKSPHAAPRAQPPRRAPPRPTAPAASADPGSYQ
jgi:serine/threonine-protein kinase